MTFFFFFAICQKILYIIIIHWLNSVLKSLYKWMRPSNDFENVFSLFPLDVFKNSCLCIFSLRGNCEGKKKNIATVQSQGCKISPLLWWITSINFDFLSMLGVWNKDMFMSEKSSDTFWRFMILEYSYTSLTP